MSSQRTANTVTTRDGTIIHFKDWGHGPSVVFSHGWPLHGDAWEDQMLFLASHGYRTIAHDRRGHGMSDTPWHGNHTDDYADDLAQLIDALDLHCVTLVGHSTGGGEVARYIGRHGTDRVKRAVLVSAVTPLMVRTDDNPEGVAAAVFDTMRAGIEADRAQFFIDLPGVFYGYNRPGARDSQGVRDTFWLQGMQCNIRAAYECVQQFSETDFSDDLKKMDMPTLVIHGGDDQIVPLEATGRRAVDLLPQGRLLVYEGAPHGLPTTHKSRLNADLLAFLRN